VHSEPLTNPAKSAKMHTAIAHKFDSPILFTPPQGLTARTKITAL